MKRSLIALSAVLSGCGGGQAGSSETGASDPDTLRVALLPDESPSTVIQNNETLRNYLAEELGKEIELVVTTDYSSMIEAMSRGRLELAYFGPVSYVLAQDRADIEPFASRVEEGQTEPTYRSVLIANADAGIESMDDVSGKGVVWGDPASTSSHLIPKSMLLDRGLQAEQDYQENFVGAHDAVALAVQNGNAEVGGLSKPIFESLVEKGTVDTSRLKVLEESEPYPNYPWTMQSGLSPKLKERIRNAFLEMDDPEVLQPLKVVGFEPVEDGDYDKVRDLAERLELSEEELARK